MSAPQVKCEVDFDLFGMQTGYLRLPLASANISEPVGYGWRPSPVISLRNGEGPTVLLIAGTHGDEYEGQIVLRRLLAHLKPEDVRGSLLILPSVNMPAVMAGTRTSPIDGGNLNRLYGARESNVTGALATFIEDVLLARADYAIDLHSGGLELEYAPCAVAACSPGEERASKSLELAIQFGAPLSMLINQSTGGDRALIGACQRQNVIHMATELGGGLVRPSTVARAEEGLWRVLRRIGVVGVVETGRAVEPLPSTLLVRRTHPDDYVYCRSEEPGLFTPLCAPGDTVSRNQLLGWIHFPLQPERTPYPISATCEGVVLCRRWPARAQFGDCLFVLGHRL
jgi:uncharacterized protein